MTYRDKFSFNQDRDENSDDDFEEPLVDSEDEDYEKSEGFDEDEEE